jgi:transposase
MTNTSTFEEQNSLTPQLLYFRLSLMEGVLELYNSPYDPQEPVVCFDEPPVQLVSETRVPLPAEPGKPQRDDYEYKREGTCNLFAFFQPLQGWRHIKVTQHRTCEDFALCMQYLVNVLFPKAARIHLVLDNLNTHTPDALYQTFAPQEALRILSKLEFHYTPKHGSWLNMVELEFSVLSRQCLERRIPSVTELQQEIEAWEHQRNQNRVMVSWRFSTGDARTKFKRLYPTPSWSSSMWWTTRSRALSLRARPESLLLLPKYKGASSMNGQTLAASA